MASHLENGDTITDAKNKDVDVKMNLQDLFSELHKLNHTDKLRAMQFLANELAVEEEALLKPGTQYEVWSPYDAPGAAQTLLDMLEADKKFRNV